MRQKKSEKMEEKKGQMTRTKFTVLWEIMMFCIFAVFLFFMSLSAKPKSTSTASNSSSPVKRASSPKQEDNLLLPPDAQHLKMERECLQGNQESCKIYKEWENIRLTNKELTTDSSTSKPEKPNPIFSGDRIRGEYEQDERRRQRDALQPAIKEMCLQGNDEACRQAKHWEAIR